MANIYWWSMEWRKKDETEDLDSCINCIYDLLFKESGNSLILNYI